MVGLWMLKLRSALLKITVIAYAFFTAALLLRTAAPITVRFCFRSRQRIDGRYDADGCVEHSDIFDSAPDHRFA
jgi:hypothetical protein